MFLVLSPEMATIKPYPIDVGASLMKCITDLKNEKNPKSHLSIYETLTQLVLKSPSRNEPIAESLQSVAIPITLEDISSGNDALALAALSFLGGSLQVLKLSPDKIDMVVEVLTGKLERVSEKNQSRKLMWSLANIQTDKEIKQSNLERMIHTACKFLDPNPPVFSLSTVCESLNALRNIGGRHREFFEDKLSTVLSSVLPWLFNEADRIRELSLLCLEPFTAEIAAKRLFDSSLQSVLRNKYYGMLTQLVLAESVDSLKIWSFLIQAFGTQLHDSVSLLNELLKIEESALKCKNPVFRQRALEHWRYIIDCFALNPVVLNNSKRIKLVLVPLKSTDTRTVDFSKTKIELWWHLLDKLGPNADSRFQEVTLPLLTFCFGVKDDNQRNLGTALVFTNVLPLATAVLAGILSSDMEFEASPIEGVQLTRSHLLLNSEDFNSTVEYLGQLSLLSLSLKPVGEADQSNETVVRCFIERCCSADLKEPLSKFICSLLTTVTTKPGLMGVVFEVLAKSFSFPLLVELVSYNMDSLFTWFIENEPLPTHPIVCFLSAFFDAGLVWNVSEFTSSFIRSFEATAYNQDTKSISTGSTSAELWSQFATILVAKRQILEFKNVNRQLLSIPFSWSQIKSDKTIFEPWSLLVSTWMKEDSTIMETVLKPPDGSDAIFVEESLVRCFLSAISADAHLHAPQISSWVKLWTESWIKFASNSENQPKRVDLFVNFINLLTEEIGPSSDRLIEEVKTCLQESSLSKEVSEIISGLFGSATSSLKGEKIQKLRQNTKVCKMFSPLVSKNVARSKQKPKFLDDFVVVPPTQKKRVLTEHQKEVMRSKRRSSCVPALYNDLSQSSLSNSVDTNSDDVASVQSTSICLPILREEDALLEPPVHSQLSTANQDEKSVSDIAQLCQNDSKLRSKVSVQVSKLPVNNRRLTRRSSSQSSSPTTSVTSTDSETLQSPTVEDVVIFQRPGPASKKRFLPSKLPLIKKLKAADSETNEEVIQSQVIVPDSLTDESCNKENGTAETTLIPTVSVTSYASPRRVSLQPVIDNLDQETATSPANPSAPFQVENEVEKCVENPSIPLVDLADNEERNQNQSVTEALSSEWMESEEPMEDDPTPHEKPNETVEVLAQAEVSKNDYLSQSVSLEPSRSVDSNDPVKEDVTVAELSSNTTVPESVEVNQANNPSQKQPEDIPTPEVVTLNDCQKPEIVQQKMLMVPFKSMMKSLTLRTKKISTPKSIGPSPSTGKRGAHILELSRKIQNEPPSKKTKKGESPQTEGQSGESVHISVVETVVTPEGSPARTQQWIPRTYSPFASPSTGILKKRALLLEEPVEAGEALAFSPASSASKSRRVSFADPEVSHSVKISPVNNKRLSRNRTRRSLITTYETSLDKEVEGDAEGVVTADENTPSLDVSLCETEPVSDSKDSDSHSLPVAESSDSQQENDAIHSEEEKSNAVITDQDSIAPSQESPTDLKNSDSLLLSFYPKAAANQDPLTGILNQVTSLSSRAHLSSLFEKLGVHTIGEFCSLREADIEQLDFQLPENQTIVHFLDCYFEKELTPEPEPENSSPIEKPVLNEPVDVKPTQVVSDLAISSSDEMRIMEELVPSSSEQNIEEESAKSPDISPNAQIITDTPSPPSSYPCDQNNTSVTPDTIEDQVEDEDITDKSASASIAASPTDIPTSGFQQLSADEIVHLIEQHPLKDDIISSVIKKYVSFSFNVNGKVFPFPQ